MNNSSSKLQYRPEIDGVRALAVIAVIINHFNSEVLPSGFLGVDIFFVISGFIITSRLLGNVSNSKWEFIINFYKRRIKRLLPALLFYVLVMSLLISLFSSNPATILYTGFSSIFGLSNLFLITQSTNYFSDPSKLNVFTHTWSLGVEEQFYFIFPLIVWLSGYGRVKQARNGDFKLLIVISILSVISLIFFIYSHNQQNKLYDAIAYFSTISRFWELGIGILISLVLNETKKIRIKHKILKKYIIYLVTIMIVMCFMVPKEHILVSTLLVVLLTCILIISFDHSSNYNVYINKYIVIIGKMSYSLYLWHWGVISLSHWTIGIQWWTIPFQIILISIMSYISYHLIEMRLRHGSWFGASPLGTIGYGLSFSSMSAIVVLLLARPLAGKLFINQDEIPTLRRQVIDGNLIECDYYKSRKSFNPEVDTLDCSYQPKLAEWSGRTVYYLGNSHAGHLSGLISNLRYTTDLRQTIFFMGGVPNPPIPVDYYASNEWDWRSIDASTQHNISDYVLSTAAKSGDIVVYSNSINSIFSANYSLNPNNQLLRMDYWFSELQKYAIKANNRGIDLVVFLPTPRFYSSIDQDFNTENCYSFWFSSPLQKDCMFYESRSKILNDTKVITNRLYEFSKKWDNVHLFDPFSVLCPSTNEKCSSIVNGKVAYFDKTHLNNYGSSLLAEPFRYFISEEIDTK